MNDAFVELLVKRKRQVGAAVFGWLLVIVGGFSILLTALTGNVVTLLAGIAFLVLAYLVRYNSLVEYEYLYLDKELSVDKIKNRTGRKRVAEYALSNLELLAPADSHRMDSYRDRTDIKTRDFSAGDRDGRPYAMITRTGSETQRILLEMNDELLEQIGRIAPRKVFRD